MKKKLNFHLYSDFEGVMKPCGKIKEQDIINKDTITCNGNNGIKLTRVKKTFIDNKCDSVCTDK